MSAEDDYLTQFDTMMTKALEGLTVWPGGGAVIYPTEAVFGIEEQGDKAVISADT